MSRAPLPPLNWIRAFESAARHGSVTKAANELFISPSAVSQQIKLLEQHLNAKLFVRLGNTMQLSDQGRDLWPLMSEAFVKIGQAVSQFRANKEVGVLNVSVAPSLASKWLVPRLAIFSKQFPGIDLSIQSSMQLVDLTRGVEEIDVAIRYGNGLYPGLYSKTLLHEQIIPICSAETAKTLGPFEHPRDLSKVLLVHDRSLERDRSCPDWSSFFLEFGVTDIDTNSSLYLNQSSQVIDAVISGRSAALAKKVLADADLSSGRVVQLFNWSTKVDFAYHVLCNHGRVHVPKIKAFVDWLTNEAGGTKLE